MNKRFSLFLYVLILFICFPFFLSGQLFSEDIIDLNFDEDVYGDLIPIDVDQDGDMDILNSSETLTLFINNGNLNFTEQEEDILNFGLRFYKVIDYNLDGKDDVVFIRNNSSLMLLESSGGGTFSTVVLISGTASNWGKLSVADFDNDGDNDVILYEQQDVEVMLYRNDDENQLTFLKSVALPGEGFCDIELADINSDLNVDVYTHCITPGISWLKNDGGGDFDDLESLYTPSEPAISTSNPYDIDLDGNIDILYANEDSGEISWLINDGNENYSSPIPISTENADNSVYTAADVDNDGDIDFVTWKGSSPCLLFFYLNDGTGQFQETQITNEESFFYTDVELVDIDLDGQKDILIRYRDLNNSYVNLTSVILNNISTNSINGCMFYDENSDGMKNGDERNIAYIKSTLTPSAPIDLPNNNDCFEHRVENGIYKLSYQENPLWILTSDSSSYNVVVNNDSHEFLDFGFIPRDTFLAGQMHSVSGITRCNRNTKFDFTFQNQGTTVITEGTIWVFPDSLLSIGNQINPLDTIVNDFQFGWNFTNLYPGETIQRSIEFSIPGLGGDIEPGTLVEIFSATEAKNTQGFVNFFKSNYAQPILCAYDPNDKLISPDREGDENYTLFEDTLIYTVRFQNTGNDTAFTVIIRDTLDESLNVETFNILATSHREILRTEIEEDKYVTFTFEDILLPDSTVNFNGSQGYVSFSILTKEGLEENTIVENTASIYFDFNPPIVTNTTQNTLVECLPIIATNVDLILGAGETYTLPDGTVVDESGVYTTDILDDKDCPMETIITTIEVLTGLEELPWDNLVTISPNPTKDIFHLNINSEQNIGLKIQINDVRGNVGKSIDINSKSNLINIDGLSPGIYFIEIREREGPLLSVKKLIIL